MVRLLRKGAAQLVESPPLRPTVEREPCRYHVGLEERPYTAEEIEFMMALDAYKRRHQRPHPTWSEVLAVARSLGYRKVSEPYQLPAPVLTPAARSN